MAKIISTSLRLTVDQYLALKRRAKRERMTVSAYVVVACFGEPVNKLEKHKYWRPSHD